MNCRMAELRTPRPTINPPAHQHSNPPALDSTNPPTRHPSYMNMKNVHECAKHNVRARCTSAFTGSAFAGSAFTGSGNIFLFSQTKATCAAACMSPPWWTHHLHSAAFAGGAFAGIAKALSLCPGGQQHFFLLPRLIIGKSA
jgi:hypothetical protein